MKRSSGFRVPDPAAAERSPGRPSEAVAPPSGSRAAGPRLGDESDRISPENPDR